MRLLASLTADNRVAVVGERLCGHASESVSVSSDKIFFRLELVENCLYANVHVMTMSPSDE
jgi:hypothetical protein